MPRIFISYRRDDAVAHAGRLADSLTERFGKDQIFRDLDKIAAGADFIEAIQKAMCSWRLLANGGSRLPTRMDDADWMMRATSCVWKSLLHFSGMSGSFRFCFKERPCQAQTICLRY